MSLLFTSCHNSDKKPPHEHDWGETTYSWSVDYSSCTATRYCTSDPRHMEQEISLSTSYVSGEPTCTSDGLTIYNATFVNPAFLPQTYDYVVPAIGHSWSEPTYTLNGDSKMTAQSICARDSSHVLEETVDGVYEVITPATEEREGLGRYTFTFNSSEFTTQTHDVVIEKINSKDKPIFSIDGKTVTYGYYPQNRISDSNLILALEEDAEWISSGLYLYEDEYYGKVYSRPYSEDYQFDDGTTIARYVNYWFKYEPIEWTVLSSENDEYLLLSNLLLDASAYSSSNNNNYMNSTIRSWLNDTFYSRAFIYGDSYLKTTNVDNSASTTDGASNPYACDNTQDKVFLLSYKDYRTADYGFSTSSSDTSTREARTTDYARADGALISSNKNAYYWTRSPNSGNQHYASHIYPTGKIGYDNNTSYTYLCVRPAITISLNKN